MKNYIDFPCLWQNTWYSVEDVNWLTVYCERVQTGQRSSCVVHKTATTSDEHSNTSATTPAPGGPDDPAVRGRLKIVVSKQQRPCSADHVDDDDDDEDYDVISGIADEWKLIASVMDRLLFVLFLFISSASSLAILVVRPLMKPSIVE